jgi:serine/threonine-protein phosphatase 2A regulatory subunit B
LKNINYELDIVDIKPDNMEDLTEVITAASFHPVSCNLLMYSSSRGTIRMHDLRENSTADRHCKSKNIWIILSLTVSLVFEFEEDPAETSFFSEIISSISDVQFTQSGEQILARDYLTLKLWDIRNEKRPLEIIPIHDYLRPKLCDLYESDCIFDKFECASSSDGK